MGKSSRKHKSAKRPHAEVSRGPIGRLDARRTLLATAAGIGAFACTYLFVSFGASWQVPILVGLVSGLVADSIMRGAMVSTACFIGGTLFVHYAGGGSAYDPIQYLLAIVLCVVGGALPSLLTSAAGDSARSRVTLGIAVFVVVAVVVNLWLPLFASGFPPQSYGFNRAAALRVVPTPGTYWADYDLYRRVFYLMHEGESYWDANYQAWQGLSGQAIMPNTPWGVRLPTIFWLWRLLPNDAFAVIYLFLAFVSGGIVASAFIGGQLAGPRLSVLPAMALGAYARTIAFFPFVFFVDLPAACLALAGVALFLWAVRTRRMGILWAAAGVMLAAALMREILLYLILLAGFSAILEPAGERLKRVAPWLTALGVFAAAYVAYSIRMWPYLVHGANGVSWAHGSWDFMVNGLTRFAQSFVGGEIVLVALVVSGIVGALVASRHTGRAFSAFAVAAVAIPWIAMLWIGNPLRDYSGRFVNYWGMLVTPLALSLYPAAARVFEMGRREA